MNTVRNERGVVLVFVAMGLLLFLLFLGLALDTGWLVYVRAQGQARVDAAALAAAAALIEDFGDRKTRAEELANTFSDKNVVNSSVSPANDVAPMNYNQTSGELQEASSWNLWGGSAPCNGVRVITDVPTQVFFAGIRNVFGAGETGQENIILSAVAHLPCPGIIINNEGGRLAQLAISRAFWDFPAGCGVPRPLLDLVTAALAQITSLPVPVQVGTSIPLQLIPDLTNLTELLDNGLEPCPSTKIVPVVEDVNPGSKPIEGFAAICKTGTGEGITVTLQCGEVAPSSAGTGECFGTYASNPILIR